jgi:hypothetical protein
MKLISKFSIKNDFSVLLKQIYIPFLSIILFTHCSTLMLPDSKNYDEKLEKLNNLGSKYSSDIYLIDSTSYSGSDLRVSRDSVYFLNEMDSTNVQLPLEHIEVIEIYDLGSRLLGGIVTGATAGISAFLLSPKTGEYHEISTCCAVGTASSFGFLFGFLLSGEEEFIFYEFDE